MVKEEREVFEEEMRQIDECDAEKISTLDNARKRSPPEEIDGGQKGRHRKRVR